ncbi:uncharacterized protein CTHT_0069520 [Thermochaetoides thermophila DSM 1495]|uniref:Uncharacterized protein n=1 Tax=Chaetomium thermophilum (strain DSM 1495 / CBS 144.50 / IMI 039719) TaxID=759272 RepID=G0SHC3_CHATD|nr:hypothetical protein CTHT_0069520 [Thermochaetoides thermophila DSM 1495]EGS17612.1 hypothetical protein CTHT_0069520 [Thermochaetoides thermophila DSM 1495]
MKEYHWASNDIEQVMISLVPFLIRCMKLRLFLLVNLAVICANSADHMDDAERQLVEFQTDPDFIITTLTNTIQNLKIPAAKQRAKHKAQFNPEVKAPECAMVPWME